MVRPGDQAGSAVTVDVGKRKGLDVGVRSFSEVSGKAIGENSAPYFPPMTPDQSHLGQKLP